jgi:putative SOS response-associated peptidase YedK
MCGRYSLTNTTSSRLPPEIGPIPEFNPRYNIAPQQTAPVIRLVEGEPKFEVIRWGFRPAWLKDRNKAEINARAETVFSKPMFKHSALHRRCLVLATGWYEWQKLPGNKKQPYTFHLNDNALFAFAGIWTRWHGEDDEQEDSYAIITTDANAIAAPVHNRMPVILGITACETWLDADCKDAAKLHTLLNPYASRDLELYPVSPYVNTPKHTDEMCIAAISVD